MSTSIEFRRPGVEVREAILPRDTGGTNTGEARSVIAAKFNRGPDTPTTVNSWLQFQNLYGGWVAANDDHNFGVDAVYGYFSNAGSNAARLTVLRAVPGDSEVAQAVIEGIEFTAKSPGAWGNDVSVSIYAPTIGGGQFSNRAYTDADFDADAGTPEGRVSIQIEYPGAPPEVFSNLSTDPMSKNWAQAIINSQSRLVDVVIPTDKDFVVPESTTGELAGGVDGATAVDYPSILPKLDSIASPILLYVAAQSEGEVDTGAQDAGIQYVSGSGRGESFCIVDMERNKESTVENMENNYSSSPFAAAYWPWIYVQDPLRAPTNILKLVAPGGSVLGAIAQVDAAVGPWRAPAGAPVILRNAVNVDRALTDSELAHLNSRSKPINAIRPVNGSGVCIWGARTLNQANADRYISVRRSLNYITANLRIIAEQALFAPNGPDLWERLTNQMNDWLGRYYQRGALRGAREPEAFQVIIDESNNTPSTIASGELHIEVGVAVEFPAEFVIIRLIQHQYTVRN